MTGLARRFMVTGVVVLLSGMVWGIQMSASHDHTLSPAHGHLNLIGFVAFSIFALYYHLVPDAAATRRAGVHFWLSVLALAVLVPGIALAILGVTEVLAVAGSFLTLAQVALFGWIVVSPGGRMPAGLPAE